MKLKKRSWLYVWFHLPQIFAGHYEILCGSNPQAEAERVAWLLSWQLVKPNKACSGLWLLVRKIVVVLGLRQSH